MSGDLQDIEIIATPAVLSENITTILSRYPRLRSLIIQPDLRYPPSMLHDVARQFAGHPTLRILECASDLIVPGALNGCPRLEVVRLPFTPVRQLNDDEWGDGGNNLGDDGNEGRTREGSLDDAAEPLQAMLAGGSRARRNLGLIMRCKPDLRCIDMDEPTFWRRDSERDVGVSRLENLRIGAISSWALTNMLSWLSKPSNRDLQNLRILHMDVDYLQFPMEGIGIIASACSNIEFLKLKYAMLPPGAIHAFARHMTRLKRFALTKCDLWYSTHDWIAVIRYLTRTMSRLLSLHINSCNLRKLDAAVNVYDASDETPVSGHPLESVKVYDTGEARPTTGGLQYLVSTYQQLHTLRLDVPADCLTVPSFDMWSSSASRLRKLRKLELRCAKYDNKDNEPQAANQSPTLPTLSSLSLCSPPVLPTAWITGSSSNLTSLILNFLPFILPADAVFPLPHLRSLEIRALSVLSHQICLSSLRAFTADSPLLRHLDMEALYRDTAPMPASDLVRLIKACPGIQTFRTCKFRLPPDALEQLIGSWPHLSSFHLAGQRAISTTVTDRWCETNLAPFMNSHRLLRVFSAGIAGLRVDGFTLRETTGEGDLEKGKFHASLNSQTLKRFSAKVKGEFWWVDQVVFLWSSNCYV
ncbi:hypothetical protein HK104_000214 [Borealophlyctis nickersoniae]|nr:hypothetical protein HK104_000214 [Borealophlyctis nickersoniae]